MHIECIFIYFFINYDIMFLYAEGLSEVQVPVGKFTIMEKTEERVLNDIITLHHAQIIKPRLVSNSDKAISAPN